MFRFVFPVLGQGGRPVGRILAGIEVGLVSSSSKLLSLTD
jgi:hypothetical protein